VLLLSTEFEVTPEVVDLQFPFIVRTYFGLINESNATSSAF